MKFHPCRANTATSPVPSPTLRAFRRTRRRSRVRPRQRLRVLQIWRARSALFPAYRFSSQTPATAMTERWSMRPSRREFVKWVTASGIALSLSRLGRPRSPRFVARQTLPGRQGWNPAATGVGRIDGVAKVTGAKLYASDFRAADLPGWPAKTSHAMLVRAPDATHVYTGMDLARLSGALKPSVVVTAEDLARVGTRVPEFYAGDLFCPVGKTPLYIGQPVALLIFETFDAFDQARLEAARRHVREIRRGDRPHRACRTMARFASRAWPARRPTRPMSIRRSRKAGSVRAFRTTERPVWRRCRSRKARLCQGRDLWRADPRRARSEQSRPSGAGPRIRDPIRRSDVSRAGKRPRLVRRRQPKVSSSCSACSRPTRPRRRSRSARRGARPVQAGAHQRAVRLYGRRIRRTRPHAVPALCRAGGDVLSRPPGPARARSLSAVPGRHQAACLQDAHADRRRSGDRQDQRLRRRSRPGWRRSRQFFGQRRDRRRHRARSASTTFRKSTSPRSRCIRAA